MIQKIDACLKERGYSFIKVSPEEVGVYYRFTEGRAQVVAGIFMHPGFVLETEKLQAIQKKLQELFLHPEGRIPGCEQNMAIYQVELLTLLVADDIGQARMLGGSCRNVWLINEQTGQLMILKPAGRFLWIKRCITGTDIRWWEAKRLCFTGVCTDGQLP